MLKFFCSRQRKIILGSLYSEIHRQLLEVICTMDTLCLPGMSGCVLRHIRDARAALTPLRDPLMCKRGLPSSHSTLLLYASGTCNIFRTITLLRMFSFRCAVPPGQALTPTPRHPNHSDSLPSAAEGVPGQRSLPSAKQAPAPESSQPG